VFAMQPLILIVGFAMATLGVALLLVGEAPFVAGKRIPALRSRLIGLVLIGFLPLALGLRQLSKLLFEADTVEGPVLTLVVFGLCWFAVIVILFRVMVPKRPPRRAAAIAMKTKKNPFEEPPVPKAEIETWPEPEPAKKPAPKKKAPKPSADDGSPFDFS
jgi:hypothetical protein